MMLNMGSQMSHFSHFNVGYQDGDVNCPSKREFGVEMVEGSNENNIKFSAFQKNGVNNLNPNINANNPGKYFSKVNSKFIQTTMEVNAFLEKENNVCSKENNLMLKDKKMQPLHNTHQMSNHAIYNFSNHTNNSTNPHLNCKSAKLASLKVPLYHRFTESIPHEYLIDIWESLKEEEAEIFFHGKISYNNIQSQKDINEKMRAILIDWLIDVHLKFSLGTETLFLTISIIDRYISAKQILRTKLQLIGVAALFIACKYEEIYCPDLRDFVYVTDKTYSKEEILTAEKEILFTLSFSVTAPTPFRFFEIISLNFNFNEIEFTYGKYLLEFYLIDCKMNKYAPSLIALAVAYIIMKLNNYPNYQEIYSLINKNVNSWSEDLTGNNSDNMHCPSSSKTLKECAKEIYYLVEHAEILNFKAVSKKYALPENLMVSVYGMDGEININTQSLKNYGCSEELEIKDSHIQNLQSQGYNF